MKSICFVCHGSICRSPAAMVIMQNKLDLLGKSADFTVFSRALTTEEIGNDIYLPMVICNHHS